MEYNHYVRVTQPPDMKNLQRITTHKFKGKILATGGMGTLDENEINVEEDMDED